MSAPALLPIVSRGHDLSFAICDQGDLAALEAINWRLNSRGYIVARIDGRDTGMHRFLLGLPPGDKREVDHINRVKVDNRRSNLRVLTHRENTANHPGFGGSSEFRGVFVTEAGNFAAKVRIAGRLHHVGTFPSEVMAAEAVDAYRLAHMPGALSEVERAA